LFASNLPAWAMHWLLVEPAKLPQLQRLIAWLKQKMNLFASRLKMRLPCFHDWAELPELRRLPQRPMPACSLKPMHWLLH
jgi:hypothetical protein